MTDWSPSPLWQEKRRSHTERRICAVQCQHSPSSRHRALVVWLCAKCLCRRTNQGEGRDKGCVCGCVCGCVWLHARPSRRVKGREMRGAALQWSSEETTSKLKWCSGEFLHLLSLHLLLCIFALALQTQTKAVHFNILKLIQTSSQFAFKNEMSAIQ